MPAYETLKRQLVRIGAEIQRLIDEARTVADLNDEDLARWQTTCQTLSTQIAENTLRVAVVGPIKSGKSTFVNTLFGGDYLKRGAGVVTSIVTRVRCGERLQADLFLKSWDDVNREIQAATVLLPAVDRSGEDQPFDIRRENDRRRLARALAGLAAEQLIVNDARSAGSVLLGAFLRGYERVRGQVADDPTTLFFRGEDFGRHREFVGDDAMAIYLKDLLLTIDTPAVGEGVEIADCQGSDSPNPLHLAMIQDYLALAHLTVYVISSRTGLRQADIRFLSMLRKMGMLETAVFVVNCDFSEHTSLDDLQAGVRKIETDLRLLSPDPRVFSFSALFSLMSQTTAALPPRERERFGQWCRDQEMVAFAEAEQARFAHFLEGRIHRQRSTLLLKNHLERLDIVAGGIDHWIGFNRDLGTRDADGARELVARIRSRGAHLDQMKRAIQTTLAGAVGQLKTALKRDIDRFFDVDSPAGGVDGVVRLVRHYTVDLHRYDESLKTAGFANTLYLAFQEFKQTVDAYMAETVNPQVIHFIKAQELKLVETLDGIVAPYGAMIDEALAQVSADVDPAPPISIAGELETIRRMAALALPPATATLRYSAQIQTEAVMRFGFYKIIHFLKRAFKHAGEPAGQERFSALAAGVARMKRETERSIRFHLKDYRENIKFQYLLKLADAAAAALHRQMLERFRHQGGDLSRLVERIGEQGLDQERTMAAMDRLAKACHCLKADITVLRSAIQALNPPVTQGDGPAPGA